MVRITFNAFIIAILFGCGGSPLEMEAGNGQPTIRLASRVEISAIPLAENPAASAVKRLYQASLGSADDPEGIRWWAHQLDMGQAHLKDVAVALQSSQKFVQRYGQPDSIQYVRQLYHHVLQREPDPEGLIFYAENLDTGRIDRADLMLAFADSPENRLRHAQAGKPAATAEQRDRRTRQDGLADNRGARFEPEMRNVLGDTFRNEHPGEEKEFRR